jgi:DNA invertase Pin-like site-specific DNA recombinase
MRSYLLNGQNVGYLRVSTALQNPERQLDGINLDITFTDHCSGSDRNRPELVACLKHLRVGDTLHVHSIDRLARNLHDLQSLVSELSDHGVSINFHKENLLFTGSNDPFQKLTLQLLGAFAEFERQMIKERQREGIAIAKRKGKQIGAKQKLTDIQIQEIRKRVIRGEKKQSLSKEYGVSRQTIYNVLNRTNYP